VTLDGQGHAVSDDAPNYEGVGIAVNGTDRLSNVRITDVVVEGWRWNGFGNVGHNIRMEEVDDAELSEVLVSGGDHGVWLTNVTNTTIADSDIDQTKNTALYLESQSHDNRIEDSQITQSDDRGVLIHNSRNNTLHGNEIAGSGNENVRLAWTASWNTFTDNHVHSTSWTDGCVSIGQSGSHLYFAGNNVSGCAGDGISASQAGSNLTFADNRVSGTDGHGIRLNRAANSTVRNNTISGTGGHGLNLQRSSEYVVRDNDVTDVERFGLNFNDAHRSTAANNRISGVGDGGVRMVRGSSENTLSDNSIFSYSRSRVLTFPTAIRLRTADNNTVVDNDIESGYRGIEVNDSANNNTLTDNSIYNANGSTWTFSTARSDGTTVERLGVTSPTAPNTTLSFTARNVSIALNESAPTNPNANGVGHVFEAESFGPPSYLDVRVHYAQSDVSGVDESFLALWTHDGAWSEVDRSHVNPRARTVGANLTSYSTIGAYATGDGESHAITPEATPTPQPTSTPGGTDTATDTTTATSAVTATGTDTPTDTDTATQTGTASATATSGATTTEDGPGFGVLVTLVALLGVALLSRRPSP
jgi:PGF-CTERM protein